jgi:phenol/toluene 2-monooxygenase (NADH) P4/A4
MPIAAVKDYLGVPLDVEANFRGNRVIFVRWNEHQLFAGPFCFGVSPELVFREFISTVLLPVIAPHPDAAAIDWEAVQWTKSGQPWKPSFDRTLAENEMFHKELVAFTTPGLNGYEGAGV